jgi:hypothetical protein
MPYTLYVIELKRKVAKRNKFKKRNPEYANKKRCVYVGMTSKTPEQRLQEHLNKAVGKKGNKLYSTMVAKHGKEEGLLERLWRNYRAIPTKALAEAAAKRLAERLRSTRRTGTDLLNPPPHPHSNEEESQAYHPQDTRAGNGILGQ